MTRHPIDAGLDLGGGQDIKNAQHAVVMESPRSRRRRRLVRACHWIRRGAGGGSAINVATHFIDFLRLLTGKEVARVSAIMHARTRRGDVEDYSLLTMQTHDGVIGLVETGYSFPSSADEQREFSFIFACDRTYAKSGPDRIEIRDRNSVAAGTRSLRIRVETDVYYPIFVKRVLTECRTGAKPMASLRDVEAMMQVMDAAYASARQGGAPQTHAPILA